jgi:ketosteroid isomerase-like protein
MKPDEFIPTYERALATQDWSQVEPLIHPDACVTFSNGTVHKGRSEVRKAFERNFSLIKDETYSMKNVDWILKSSETAVYLFEFSWSGTINGQPANGSGTGTSVLIKEAMNGSYLSSTLVQKPLNRFDRESLNICGDRRHGQARLFNDGSHIK